MAVVAVVAAVGGGGGRGGAAEDDEDNRTTEGEEDYENKTNIMTSSKMFAVASAILVTALLVRPRLQR